MEKLWNNCQANLKKCLKKSGVKGTSILARTSSTSSNGERKKHSSQNYWSTSSSFYLWELQQLTSFGFSMRYWTKDCLNWPCWILIPFTISSCSDKAWNIQFPDPWLSEILRPLSDTIVVNSSVKVVLLLTVLAQSCIPWRFWIVRSSSPRTKIIFSEFPWIMQCRWKGRFQLKRRKNHIKDRISVHREYFLTHWELHRYRHSKLRETCIWSNSARTHC